MHVQSGAAQIRQLIRTDLQADSAMDSKRRSKGVDKAFADAVEEEMAHLQPDDLPAKPYMSKSFAPGTALCPLEQTLTITRGLN